MSSRDAVGRRVQLIMKEIDRQGAPPDITSEERRSLLQQVVEECQIRLQTLDQELGKKKY